MRFSNYLNVWINAHKVLTGPPFLKDVVIHLTNHP